MKIEFDECTKCAHFVILCKWHEISVMVRWIQRMKLCVNNKNIRVLFCVLALIFCPPSFSGEKTQLIFTDIVDQLPSSIVAQRVLRAAYQRMGIGITFLLVPNLRTKTLLENHEVDGMSYRFSDAPIQNLVKLSVPITSEDLCVYTVDKKFVVNGYQSLRPYSIGYLNGARIFDDNLKEMRTETAPSEESLLRKLSAGRTDLVVESRASLCTAKKLGLNNVVMLEPSLESVLGYHWLSPAHQNLIPKLEQILKEMAREGTIKKIQRQVWDDYNADCANVK
ncbi:transporter substrate-binding domain-containing protein [Undibacterium jejuense]|uniref:Transporter substrate-binding domain-containing protein n=1 Tax=Undibacterium jejuense TaxID=1344949 RepID=A0A923KMX7_9BURK|nr:transporter substrate-binding domain-containing protein [Undibacterium jejuense]MBC3860609.1 transporter substrate-binding domain-containing protein [Undibacterium jejuense]